ncbi:MAG: carboxypeptidase-like regulatory domain-containing protein [Bacteroidales bacterium]|nr:carboxypeptidase-like regulatory domain-containing protein [Bacteroidales bacterium]
MKKRIIRFSLLVIVIACLFTACKPESYDTFGNISGTVIDMDSKEAIEGALVTLSPTGKNSFTGVDGYFELKELEAGQYTLTVQKSDYESNRKIVNVVAGETTNESLTMKKK